MFYVYIIQSQKDNTFYKGFSEHPLVRFIFHNEGKSKYTSKKIPWKLVALFEFNSKNEALIKEKKIKKYPNKSLIALIKSEKNILDQFLVSHEKC
jgi:putative endonuclease